jgi:hypothetical protein
MTKPRMMVASHSKLPTVDVAVDDTEIQQRCRVLLEQATKARVKESEAREEIEKAGGELAEICEAYGLKGFRDGLNKFEYFGWQTRKTLSAQRLLALGVAADVIKQAYQESKPFLSTRIAPFDIE